MIVEIPGNPSVWQELYDMGVDKINVSTYWRSNMDHDAKIVQVDDLQNVAAVNFLL